MRELIADLFVSLDGFASGTNGPAYFDRASFDEAIH
jgi:hypothetical protein